jgi:hypothetical protein
MISYGRVDYDFLARVGVVPAKNGSLKKALSDLYNEHRGRHVGPQRSD